MTKAKPAKNGSETDEAEDKAPAKAKKAKTAGEGAESEAPAAKRSAKSASDGSLAKGSKGKVGKAKRGEAADDAAAPDGDMDELDAAAPKEEDAQDAEASEEAEIADDVFEIEADEIAEADIPLPEEEKFVPAKRSTGAPAPVTPAPPREEPKPAVAFSNSGLGVRIVSKKPALSVAPGVMIQGRAAAPVAKPEGQAKTTERKLSEKELEDIKTFLLERRERLLAATRRELALQRERAENKAADEVDKATDAYDEDLSFEIAAANDQELEEIRVALEKIEKGTYGECEVCGCNISPSRLKILPSATTCVSCRGQEELARRREETPSFSMLGGEEGETETPEV